ncbi:hypothetical protein HOI26_01550 [Candidatus Woesearchaeota archaeon]|jgi:hypothetical protein|nr:hypothetical protein [Candidatus Woesearchaeota archaeon]MBT5739760.1 hypothetical protein [Candidatus Woesearchaeota archaeon]
MTIFKWDLYEISTETSPVQGVMFRGRVRKFGLQQQRTILTENATDKENVVRFAVPHGEDVTEIKKFVSSIVADSQVTLIQAALKNPVLAQFRCNIESRYTI